MDEDWNPVGDTPFVGEDLYGGDGEWPDWPDQDMLNWVPEEIQSKLGERTFSFVSGPCLRFSKNNENEIVRAFQDHRYAVEKDERLVSEACGY